MFSHAQTDASNHLGMGVGSAFANGQGDRQIYTIPNTNDYKTDFLTHPVLGPPYVIVRVVHPSIGTMYWERSGNRILFNFNKVAVSTEHGDSI